MKATAQTASTDSTPSPGSSQGSPERPRYSEIVDMRLQQGYLSDDHAVYARRLQAKLETPCRRLDVLKERDCVCGDQVKKATQENLLSMRIGSLLVELGCITAGTTGHGE